MARELLYIARRTASNKELAKRCNDIQDSVNAQSLPEPMMNSNEEIEVPMQYQRNLKVLEPDLKRLVGPTVGTEPEAKRRKR